MSSTWSDKLASDMPEELAREVDIYETNIELRKNGQLDEKIFAEMRLRRGAYGQRYDNGQRHDGEKTQTIDFGRDLEKGPDTAFDAPGMLRIKIPYGGVTAAQMEVMADTVRGVLDRRSPRHHAPGHPGPLRPHRRHTQLHAAASPRPASLLAKPAETPSATLPRAPTPASAPTNPSTSRRTRRPT